LVSVRNLVFSTSSPKTIAPVPSPGTGSSIVTEQSVQRPSTAPRTCTKTTPSPSRTCSVPSPGARLPASATAGTVTATTAEKSSSFRMVRLIVDTAGSAPVSAV
jgi:hypothetical protein